MQQNIYGEERERFLLNGKELGISFTDKQIEQFFLYYRVLVEKNKVMNLTGITELPEVLQKHFIDSLTICKSISMEEIDTILDIGTGAGFPGIPLKIVFPHLRVTLLDSLKKRLDFLKEVINVLNMNDVIILHGRAEDYARKKEYREKYDLCVSRAVANLTTLSEYCLPYVKVGGSFISYKSGKVEQELFEAKKAIQLLGGDILDVKSFFLPGSDMKRTLIKIEKIQKTSNKFPRRAGIPSKEPIC